MLLVVENSILAWAVENYGELVMDETMEELELVMEENSDRQAMLDNSEAPTLHCGLPGHCSAFALVHAGGCLR